jgi:ABC-type molybdate transport system ATPase subunit
MDVYGYMKRAFEETVGTEDRATREIQRFEARITGLENRMASLQAKIEATDVNVSRARSEMISIKNELLAKIRRLDARS